MLAVGDISSIPITLLLTVLMPLVLLKLVKPFSYCMCRQELSRCILKLAPQLIFPLT